MYNSKLVTRLINNIMYDGKKGVAQKIVYGAFEIVEEKTGKNALEVFEQAMENVMPSPGGQGPPCWRCDLSGSDGGSSGETTDPGSALDDELFQTPF